MRISHYIYVQLSACLKSKVKTDIEEPLSSPVNDCVPMMKANVTSLSFYFESTQKWYHAARLGKADIVENKIVIIFFFFF